MHIVLLGDSIFDNASYVSEGESVSELLSKKLPGVKISLAAIDGDVTTDVFAQLEKRAPQQNLWVNSGSGSAPSA